MIPAERDHVGIGRRRFPRQVEAVADEIGEVLDLRLLVIMGEDDRVALLLEARALLEHAADLELVSIENRLLILDYRLMHLWFGVTRTLAPVQARKAVTEMASVLVVLVRKMSEQWSGPQF